ncbi:MAG: cytochrome c biogenesis protein CcsA [Fibrobacteraceae bacterium]|nr:cytochrome c biogenesis protein CcsA [Fibrobacteraceae bacterium]
MRNILKVGLFLLYFVASSFAYEPTFPVLHENRVKPFDSFARSLMDDFLGKTSHASKTVNHILEKPEETAQWNLFKVVRSDVAAALNLPTDKRYVSYSELNRARSLLEIYASREDNHPATQEMKHLYKVLLEYENMQVVPAKATGKEFVEVFYHKVNFCLLGFIFASLSFLLMTVKSFTNKFKKIESFLFAFLTFLILISIALRFYIQGCVPLINLYEILLFVCFLLALVAFIIKSLRLPVALLLCVMLFFEKFGLETGDTFQTIPSILNSSLFLTIHVFTIALGFCGMILSGVVAHLILFRSLIQANIGSMSRLLYGTLVFGCVFTVLGTLFGGVWADVAWGRFWGFDIKECGALFVCLWGMLALHLKSSGLVDIRGFALFNCFNIMVTFLCWFGINLLGVGLHSYGFQSGTFIWLASFVLVDGAFIIFLNFKHASMGNSFIGHSLRPPRR